MDSSRAFDAVAVEKIRLLFRQQPIVLGVGILNALVFAAVMAPVVPGAWLALWVGLIALVNALRLLLWRWLRQGAPEWLRRMRLVAFLGAGASGLLWGGGLASMYPADEDYRIFVAFVAGGMAAGSVVTLSSYRPAFLAFILPCLLPVAGRFAIEEGAVYMAMAVLIVVFGAALWLVANNLNRLLSETIGLQAERGRLLDELRMVLGGLEERVAERTRELEEANHRLLAEVADRRRAEEAEHRARREAENATAERTKFLAAASHDLRQPLQAMRLFYDLLMHQLGRQGAAYPAAQRLGEAMDAGEKLLGALLDVSILESGEVRPHPQDILVDEVLTGLRREFDEAARRKGLRLRLHPSRHRVRSDPVLLSRMLRNLLANAILYTESGGVLVGCRWRPPHLRIEVWDSGIGIPPGRLESVFSDFVRLEGSGEAGLGLGLGVVRRMGRLLDHPVGASSRPGRGSVFWVEVPLAGKEARLEPASPQRR